MAHESGVGAASGYLASEQNFEHVNFELVAVPLVGSNTLALTMLGSFLKRTYYGIKLNRSIENYPEQIEPCLRGELVTMRDKACAVLGMPVGDEDFGREITG
jgi:hypothetical protein